MTNEIITNIMNHEDQTSKGIENALDYLSNTLSKTLGPYGYNTIVQDRMGSHYLTKDGYTVLKQVKVQDALSATIIDIVKDISRNLVRTVGDGSTSSIVVSNELFKQINLLIEKYEVVSPKDIIDILNYLIPVLSDLIKGKSIKVTDNNIDILKNIATISTNNDIEMGEMIKDIYKEIGAHGFINIEKSRTDVDSFKVTNGFELYRGYINPLFVNQIDKVTCELENPYVFMADYTLDDRDLPFLSELLGYCLKNGSSMVIIAKDYSSEVKVFFHENKMSLKDKLDIVALDMAVESVESADRFDDLAIALGAKPYEKSSMEDVTAEEFINDNRLGRCKKATVTDMNTFLVEPQGDKEVIEERFNGIKDDLEKAELAQTSEEFIFNLRKRMSSLSNSTAILYVGGNTEVEKESRSFLIEDAVYACQSTLKNGYIVGGNLITPKILSDKEVFNNLANKVSDQFERLKTSFNYDTNLSFDNFVSDLLTSISKAFVKSYRTVLLNAKLPEDVIDEITHKCISEPVIYNLRTRDYDSDTNLDIINSSETDIEIIKATFSIIGLLAASNQFISINEILPND